jgi:hypothetical protein
MKTLVIGAAAAAAIGFAPLTVLTSGVAQAGPLCQLPPNTPLTPQILQLHQQCLQMEQNQNLCGLASGCPPGDPCVNGSPGERQVCADERAGAQHP